MYTGHGVSTRSSPRHASQKHTFRAIGRQTLSNHPSDARTAAGDERNPAVEVIDILETKGGGHCECL